MIELSESAIQKGVQAVTGTTALPKEFGKDDPESNLYLNCVEPIIRFPKKELDTDLSPRIIIHLICSMKSPKNGISLACPYKTAVEVPDSELSSSGRTVCPQVRASIVPLAQQDMKGGFQIGLKLLQIDRLSFFPESYSKELADAYAPVERILTRNLNKSLEMIDSPWAKPAFALPVEAKSLTLSNGKKNSNKELKLDFKVKNLEINVTDRVLRIYFTTYLREVKKGLKP